MESHFNVNGTKPEENNIFIDKKSGKQFRVFKYFDHEVIQDVETGWINAGKFVLNLHRSGFTKQYLNNFKSTSDYNVALELGKRMILQRNDSTGFPVESTDLSGDKYVEISYHLNKA